MVGLLVVLAVAFDRELVGLVAILLLALPGCLLPFRAATVARGWQLLQLCTAPSRSRRCSGSRGLNPSRAGGRRLVVVVVICFISQQRLALSQLCQGGLVQAQVLLCSPLHISAWLFSVFFLELITILPPLVRLAGLLRRTCAVHFCVWPRRHLCLGSSVHLLPQRGKGSRLPLSLLFLNLPEVSQPMLLLNNENVLVKAVDKVLTHLLVGRLAEFKVLPKLIKVPVQRRLERVAVLYVIFFGEYYPGSLPLGVFVLELTGVVAELGCLLGEELRDDSRPIVALG